MEYKLIGGEEEEKKPLEEREIMKTGEVAKFSLVSMKRDFILFDKTIKELEGNRDLKLATMKNIEDHHPFVKDIPEFDRYTIHMYQEAFASFKAFDAKLQQIQKSLTEYQAELEEIQNQIPELKPIVSPYMENLEDKESLDRKKVNGEKAIADQEVDSSKPKEDDQEKPKTE